MAILNRLIEILKVSKKKHGGKTPLTLGYLYNILSLAQDLEEKEEIKLNDALDEMITQDRIWGSD